MVYKAEVTKDSNQKAGKLAVLSDVTNTTNQLISEKFKLNLEIFIGKIFTI